MRWLVLAGWVTLAGCATAGGGGGEADTGVAVDASPTQDSSPVDGAVAVDAKVDAAIAADAQPLDAQPLDAQPLDARPLDAQPLDAQPLDAQPIDAAPQPDASMCVPPVSGPCDTAPQCGCSGTQNCVVIDSTSGNTGCVTAGSTATGQRCTATSNCTRGNDCLGGVCTPYCATGTDCPGPYRMCKQAFYTDAGGAQQPTPGFDYCTRTCNPLNPSLDDATFDPCGPSLKCLPSSDRASDCYDLGVGSGTDGSLCGFTSPDDSACAVGFFCASPTGFGYVCTPFCVVGGAACTNGGTCTRFTTRQYAGPNEIGLCF